jgi:hypothetical protein
MNKRVLGSTNLAMRTFGPGPRMMYIAGWGRACCVGSDSSDALQWRANWRPASFSAKPV